MSRIRALLGTCAALSLIGSAGIAQAGDQPTLSDARAAVEHLGEASLAQIIQSAEKHVGGKAVAVRTAERNEFGSELRIDGRSASQTQSRQTSATDGRTQTGQSDQNNQNNQSRGGADAGQASNTLFVVTCLANNARLRDVIVDPASREVLGVTSTGGSGDDGYRDSTMRTRSTGTNSYYGGGDDRRYRSDRDQSDVNRRYVDNNAWPPRPGDPLYENYRRAERTPRDSDGRRTRDSRYDQSGYGYAADNRYGDDGAQRYDRGYASSTRYGDSRYGNNDPGYATAPSRIELASKLMNTSARSLAGEDLGYIDDLALNPANHGVVYAVLKHGGFLGLGQKSFAVPLEDLDRRDGNVVLHVNKRELERADGFDTSNWPKQADRRWSNRWDATAAQPASQIAKASAMIDKDVYSQDGEEIGDISDLAIDLVKGQVAYVIVDCDEGDGVIVVPTSALSNTGDRCVVQLNRAQLATVPRYDEATEPNWNNAGWNRRMHDRFNSDPYWND